MARTAIPAQIEAITFGEWTPEEASNPFISDVQTLADKNSENAAMVVRVDVNDKTKTQFKIQRAANQIGKTARLRHVDDSAVKVVGKDDDGDVIEGIVALTFTLTNKQKARRGPTAPSAVKAAEEEATK